MSNFFVWTDDKIADLEKLWGNGRSATEIARELSTTRNAIIGKVHRLGLTREPKLVSDQERKQRVADMLRRKAEAQRIKRQQRPDQPRKRRRKKMQDQKIGPVFEGFVGIPFADLRPFSAVEVNECRYIPAEPPGPDYLACGNKTGMGETYCEHCKDIVFARPWKITEQDRQRRVFTMRKAAIPRTIAGLDVVEDAA